MRWHVTSRDQPDVKLGIVEAKSPYTAFEAARDQFNTLKVDVCLVDDEGYGKYLIACQVRKWGAQGIYSVVHNTIIANSANEALGKFVDINGACYEVGMPVSIEFHTLSLGGRP